MPTPSFGSHKTSKHQAAVSEKFPDWQGERLLLHLRSAADGPSVGQENAPRGRRHINTKTIMFIISATQQHIVWNSAYSAQKSCKTQMIGSDIAYYNNQAQKEALAT